jgi:hypothetical protein
VFNQEINLNSTANNPAPISGSHVKVHSAVVIQTQLVQHAKIGCLWCIKRALSPYLLKTPWFWKGVLDVTGCEDAQVSGHILGGRTRHGRCSPYHDKRIRCVCYCQANTYIYVSIYI